MHDISRDSALLSENKTLENLYQLTCAHGDAVAAIWLEGEEKKQWTFSDYARKTRNYAAFLKESKISKQEVDRLKQMLDDMEV